MLSNLSSPKRWLQDHFKSADEVLHACIRDGDLRQLQQLLGASRAPNINYNHSGNYKYSGFGPPVHFASRCGNLEAVELLLAAGADPMLVSHGEERLTAIGYAAQKGHRDVVMRLWMFCPPEGHVNGMGPYSTCLVVAAIHGHAAVVEDLLDWWDGWPHDLKYNALIGAVQGWHLAVATLLLNRASFQLPTLQEALQSATYPRYLTSYRDEDKCDDLDYLNQQLLVEMLIDAGADPNHSHHPPLIYTVAGDANLTGVLKTLLEKGADPNKTTTSGHSALHVLAEPVGRGRPFQIRGPAQPRFLNETAIRLLLQHKASVSQPDDAGECPLHWAAFGLDLRLFRLYLSSRPDQGQDALLQLTNHNGETLLHFAAAGCHVEVIEFLIAQGLNINAKSSNGWAPLMCALVPINRRSGLVTSPTESMRAAQCLLSHGADASITTDEGWTPLHGLSLHRYDDVSGKAEDLTKNLISRGVSPEARARLLSPDSKNTVPLLGLPWGYRLRDTMARPQTKKMIIRPVLTPIYWAAERGAIGVIKALLAHGVDVSLMDEDGISPARMAAESKFLEKQPDLVDKIVELLLAAGAGF